MIESAVGYGFNEINLNALFFKLENEETCKREQKNCLIN
jgi:hypothetical protein